MTLRMRLIPTLASLAAITLGAAALSASQGMVMAVGGGSVGDDLLRTLVQASSAQNPSVLIIPHAARPNRLESSGTRAADRFTKLGVKNVTILDLEDPEAARQAIRSADVIWMPGGLQTNLYRALRQARLLDEVRARHKAGVPIGGTSAGAAIMSATMLSGSATDPATGEPNPRIGRGLGLWPEVVVDQHFSERNRQPRLRVAVRRNPNLIGIGVDERTAAIYDGTSFTVMGPGTVTVMRLADPSNPDGEMIEKILKPGESYRTK